MRFVLSLLMCSLVFFSACADDDPEFIETIVTVRDTITVTQYDTTIVTMTDTTIITQTDTVIIIERDTILQLVPEEESVLVICVRHAETTGIGSDPSLSAEGMTRAMDLSHQLSNMDLAAVYSSNFNRTQETAAVTASDQNLSVTTYNAFNIPGFASSLKNDHKGETVLVVGHSNTTPELINELTQSTNIAQFDETTYDNLYIVNIKINGEGIVYHLEYGEETP